MAERQHVVFSIDQAAECAHEVVHHDPSESRTISWVPADKDAGAAGVSALSSELNGLAKSIRNALANAEDSASLISDDRLQGIAELIQNADDLGATRAEIHVDEKSSRLLFRHNGAGLTLHDVWALAIPWLSLKSNDAEALGRFGIGLKTLQALSDVLEVHQGHFRVRFERLDLAPAGGSPSWPTPEPAEHLTTFLVPFGRGAATVDAVEAWLHLWSDAGLIFLRSLSTVTLVGKAGRTVANLHVDRGPSEPVASERAEMHRQHVSAADGRTWAVYSRSVPVPKGHRRARKAQASGIPLAIAFTLRGTDTGFLHVGLPVREIGLPFRLLAPFDPLTSRRDIADKAWNHALVQPLSELWLDAIVDHFGRRPAAAWSAVPLKAELDDDRRTTGQLRALLDHHLMADGRTALASTLQLPYEGDLFHLRDLAYEVPRLTRLLSTDDIRIVAERPAAVASAVRSKSRRWRAVLEEFTEIDAESATIVDVQDATVLLGDPTRPVEFIADLLATAIEDSQEEDPDCDVWGWDLEDWVGDKACLVLDTGERVTPESIAGFGVLVPPEAGPLWSTLNVGARLDPTFAARPGWPVIEAWLQGEGRLATDTSDRGALHTVASAGRRGDELPEVLSDEQAATLRLAFEQLEPSDRGALGAGIGKAVRFQAFTYDDDGQRIETTARACDAYIIVTDATGWHVAAGKTPWLYWLHRRYAEKVLKSESGREGVGAQKLFRLLGAETAPRLTRHPDERRRFKAAEPGLRQDPWPDLLRAPERRQSQIRRLQASWVIGDRMSPDLEAVLTDISREKTQKERIRRANAVLASLRRDWDQIGENVRVRAANPYGTWQYVGEVDAWWVAVAASIPWLTSGSGKAAAPDHLRIRTPANEAFFGSDSGQYLSNGFDAVANREVLVALGVQGDPRPDQLLTRLQEVRSEVADDPELAAELAAPIYRALGAQVGSGETSGRAISASQLQKEFDRGEGLIATNLGWRRRSVTLNGPPVFGNLAAFVPAVRGAEPLWSALRLRRPAAKDAREVITALREATKEVVPTRDQLLIMLEALRILASTPPQDAENLRRAYVWIGDRWERKRPVYAISNPLLMRGLLGQLPIWEPGGALAQLESLIDRYGLTRLDTSHATVNHLATATYDPELTEIFRRAVRHLQRDLSLSDAESEASIRISWEELADFEVRQLAGLTLSLANIEGHSDLSFEARAWLDPSTAVLFISEPEALQMATDGAYAVATIFDTDPRTVAHAWMAAWASARDGLHAEIVRTAASREADLKRARAQGTNAEAALLDLQENAKARRKRAAQNHPGTEKQPPVATVDAAAVLQRQPQMLIDLARLALSSPDGEIIQASPRPPQSQPGPAGAPVRPSLREPDLSSPRPTRPPGSGAAPRNFTQEELESRGLELFRWVLGLDLDDQLSDIRHQHNVGADAVDELSNFYELKAHGGAIPDEIRLQPSEIERARTTEGFFLVVVGNLVSGAAGPPEIRIITDPLGQLIMKTPDVRYAGVKSAQALTYTLTEVTQSSDG